MEYSLLASLLFIGFLVCVFVILYLWRKTSASRGGGGGVDIGGYGGFGHGGGDDGCDGGGGDCGGGD
jgi:hypothetical protein